MGAAPSARRDSRVPDALQSVAILYLSIWATAPPLAFGMVYRIIAALAFGVWLLAEIARRNSIALRPNAAVLAAVGYVAYVALANILGDGLGGLVRNVQTLVVVAFIVILEGARRHGLHILKPAMWAVFVTYPIWLVTTLEALERDRHIARLLIRSSDMAEVMAEQGVGGFALVYSGLFLIPLCLLLANYAWRNPVRKSAPAQVLRLGQLAIALAGFYLAVSAVIAAGFSIAVILCLLSLMAFAAYAGTTSLRNPRSLFLIAFTLIGVIFIPLDAVLGVLSQLAGGTSYQMKINDILASLQADNSVGTVAERVERYSRSVVLFFENPIMGTITAQNIGKHSVFIDHFAQYGVFVGAIFAWLMLRTPLAALRQPGHGLGYVVAILFLAIFVPLLNNIPMAVGVLLFIAYPAARLYLDLNSARGRPRPPSFGPVHARTLGR